MRCETNTNDHSVLRVKSTCRCLLFQWHRTPTTQETDGFQVKRPGDVSVRCTLLLMLDYQVRRRRTQSHNGSQLCPETQLRLRD